MVGDPTSKLMQDTEAMLEEIMILMDERKHDWTKRKHICILSFCEVRIDIFVYSECTQECHTS